MLQRDNVGSLRNSKTGELVNPKRRQKNAAKKKLSGKTFKRLLRRINRENAI
jgi:hypothetical protein